MAQTGIDLSVLQGWLATHTPLGPCEIIAVRQPTTGYSADTLLLTVATRADQNRRIVIRMDRPGRALFRDSTIERQARVMQQLSDRGIPVPAVLAWANDAAPLGAPFLVMDHVAGVSLPQHPSYHVDGLLMDLDPAGRARTWKSALLTMAAINRVEWRADFQFLTEPAYGEEGLDHYLGWFRAWRGSTLEGEHSLIDPALDWLDANRPSSAHADLLWGDSNPGNFLFHADGRVAAALDFEAAAIGPAEVDLGIWFFIDRLLAAGRSLPEGLPDKAAQISMYEQALGRPIEDLPYFETMAAARMAIIIANLAQSLIKDGLVNSENLAGTYNPAASRLAEMIGQLHPDRMDHYMEMVTVMNVR